MTKSVPSADDERRRRIYESDAAVGGGVKVGGGRQLVKSVGDNFVREIFSNIPCENNSLVSFRSTEACCLCNMSV